MVGRRRDELGAAHRAPAFPGAAVTPAGSAPAPELFDTHAHLRFPDVWATVGIHPHDAASGDDAALGEIERLAANPRVVAVGEIGLDYFRNLSPRDDQIR